MSLNRSYTVHHILGRNVTVPGSQGGTWVGLRQVVKVALDARGTALMLKAYHTAALASCPTPVLMPTFLITMGLLPP